MVRRHSWKRSLSLTVQQLVDEHEVVLDVLLGDLPEVGLHDVAHLEQELEHHGGVHVLLGDGGQPDVGALDVEEGRARDVRHRGADLGGEGRGGEVWQVVGKRWKSYRFSLYKVCPEKAVY